MFRFRAPEIRLAVGRVISIRWLSIIYWNIYLFSFFAVCGQPSVPLNAKVKTSVSGQSGISEAHYECDSGYELFGPAVTKCDPKRGWEKELPFCGKSKAMFMQIDSLVSLTLHLLISWLLCKYLHSSYEKILIGYEVWEEAREKHLWYFVR